MIKKVIKWVIANLLLLSIIIGIITFALWAALPNGEEGIKAEQLTDKMLSALNYEAYKNLHTISWTYRKNHHYTWYKSKGKVKVQLNDFEVLLDFNAGSHKVVASDIEEKDAVDEALSNFYNDSFWLVAPFKIRDGGTTRQYVETEDGPGILVSYASGGVTPGDSYLWVLDENFRPKYWRLWTSNVFIQGLKIEWTNWQQKKGVWFASSHPVGPLSIEITNLEVK